jgi:hypothetical protein
VIAAARCPPAGFRMRLPDRHGGCDNPDPIVRPVQARATAPPPRIASRRGTWAYARVADAPGSEARGRLTLIKPAVGRSDRGYMMVDRPGLRGARLDANHAPSGLGSVVRPRPISAARTRPATPSATR